MALILSALFLAPASEARIIFEDDMFSGITSQGIIIDILDQSAGDIIIQFGTTLNETLKWNAANSSFQFSDDVDLSNHQLTTARVENVAALPGAAIGLGAEGIGRLVQLTATDITAPGCTPFACYAGQYTWNGTIWEAATNENPTDMVSVKPGESIQTAIDSLSANGGTINLLVGTHDITDSININKDNVALLGEGPGTLVRAASGSWAGSTTNNDSAIQIGPSDGTSSRDNVTIRNFTLQVGPNIHGIQINGGSEIKVTDMKVQSIGPKTDSRTGILFTDGATTPGSRFTSSSNLINSDSAPNRWVDGIHLDGNADFSGQLFGYGNGIRDSIISETIVSETQETSFAFTQVSSSSVFSNRGRNIGFTVGAFGMFFNDCNDVMVINNTMEGSNVSATGISIYDNVDNSTFIGNAVRGGPVNYTIGMDIASSTSSGNVITGNQFESVNTQIQDSGTNTKLETLHHRSTANPTSNDDIGDGYEIGTIWINTASDDSWILVDHTIGAAVWNEIDAAGGGGSTAIPSGANPPMACNGGTTGEQFIDTDTGQVYICDSTNGRNKWLAQQDTILWGEETGTCYSGSTLTSDSCTVEWGSSLGADGGNNGFYLPYPATIVGYGFSEDNDACTSGSMDIEVWSSSGTGSDGSHSFEANVATGLNNQVHNANNLNIDLSGNRYIVWGIDNNCGQNIDDYNIVLYLRYRHP